MPLLSQDRALLDGFRRGDRPSLTLVYKHYAPGIAAFLARGFTFQSKGRLLQFRGYHQPFDLENSLQETFVRAFGDRARMAYDGLTPFRTYLTTIARNLVLSEFRRREVAMSQLVYAQESASGPSSDSHHSSSDLDLVTREREVMPSAETQVIHRELRQLYGAFVEQLDGSDRAYFIARFEGRATQLEASKLSGLSHMQGRTLEKRLRRRFLRFMQSHGYLEGYSKSTAAAVTV